MSGRRALLIGVNYVGSRHELRGCHQDVRNVQQYIRSWGYNEEDTVVLTDESHVDPYSPSYPTGHNILRAFQWLVNRSEGYSLFLHYSGHGGQVPDPMGEGIDDTICPVDFEQHGQINSDILHRHLVSVMPPSAQLHAIFDCCHSGSVMELPYVYRTDDDGNVDLVDNLKQGIRLASSAAYLLQGGFTMQKVRDAEQLYAGARSFFKGLQHMGDDDDEEGLGAATTQQYRGENKRVIMYSGCRDDQTSADANIAGASTGVMSWAFLQVMAQFDGRQSYVDILRNTRDLLKDNYSQIPQLSCGQEIELNDRFTL